VEVTEIEQAKARVRLRGARGRERGHYPDVRSAAPVARGRNARRAQLWLTSVGTYSPLLSGLGVGRRKMSDERRVALVTGMRAASAARLQTLAARGCAVAVVDRDDAGRARHRPADRRGRRRRRFWAADVADAR
jgi:hypothetical protein